MAAVVENNGNEEVIEVPYNSTIDELDAPVILGYDFGGWYSNDQAYNFNSNITEDIQIEAKLTPITYQINYKVWLLYIQLRLLSIRILELNQRRLYRNRLREKRQSLHQDILRWLLLKIL